MDELPRARRARISPSMDSREQLRLYAQQLGVEAARRQVRAHREELARQQKPKPKR